MKKARFLGGLGMTKWGAFIHKDNVAGLLSYVCFSNKKYVIPCHPMFVLRRKYPLCHEEISEVFPILWTEKR